MVHPVTICSVTGVLERTDQRKWLYQTAILTADMPLTILEDSLESNSSICAVRNGTPLQYSCLENSMDGGAWKAAVHGVTRIRTRLSDFIFTFHFHALEKEMATHSSVLAWRIPGWAEPGGLPSMGSHRVGHDWSNLAAAEWIPILSLGAVTPVEETI